MEMTVFIRPTLSMCRYTATDYFLNRGRNNCQRHLYPFFHLPLSAQVCDSTPLPVYLLIRYVVSR